MAPLRAQFGDPISPPQPIYRKTSLSLKLSGNFHWDIPSNIAPARYEVIHEGISKSLWGNKLSNYDGATEYFEIK